MNPAPIPPALDSAESDSSDEDQVDDVNADDCFETELDESNPHLLMLSKSISDDLVKDPSLSKEKSELLASRLEECEICYKRVPQSRTFVTVKRS